jgi:hypothetical protein
VVRDRPSPEGSTVESKSVTLRAVAVIDAMGKRQASATAPQNEEPAGSSDLALSVLTLLAYDDKSTTR